MPNKSLTASRIRVEKPGLWRTPEQAILSKSYPLGGWRACIELLPGRSRGGIQQRAAHCNIRSPREERRGKPRQRYAHNANIDAAIRRVYEAKPDRKAVRCLVERLQRPRWWISKRAVAMGLVVPRYKEAPWSDEEYDLLDCHAHKTASVISRIFKAAGYQRTATSISLVRKRASLGVIACRQTAGLYSANQIAGLFGVDSKTVTRWIGLGMLKATRRGTGRTAAQGGDEHEIAAAAVRKFVLENPERVDLAKVDRMWFIEMLGRPS